MIEELPLEFKLYLKGKHVGFERHGNGLIYHLLKKSEWSPDPQYMPIKIGAETGNFYIKHDEKRQYTGLKVKNRKICFGDKLKIPGDDLIFTVEFKGGRIFATHPDMSPGFGYNGFYKMELIDDTP